MPTMTTTPAHEVTRALDAWPSPQGCQGSHCAACHANPASTPAAAWTTTYEASHRSAAAPSHWTAQGRHRAA